MPAATSTGAGSASSTEPSGVVPGMGVIGAPNVSARPLASAANLALSTWLMANSTMNRTRSSVIMSA
jgi:hypothetical protein